MRTEPAVSGRQLAPGGKSPILGIQAQNTCINVYPHITYVCIHISQCVRVCVCVIPKCFHRETLNLLNFLSSLSSLMAQILTESREPLTLDPWKYAPFSNDTAPTGCSVSFFCVCVCACVHVCIARWDTLKYWQIPWDTHAVCVLKSILVYVWRCSIVISWDLWLGL